MCMVMLIDYKAVNTSHRLKILASERLGQAMYAGSRDVCHVRYNIKIRFIMLALMTETK